MTFPLAEVFKLDVRGMKSIDDYTKLLSKKGRWNFKDRQKKFNNAKVINHEYVDLPPGSTEMVASLWPLYKSTGDANGFCVLSEKEFADFHLNTPGLTLMLIRDVAAEGKLITFCTGVRVEDTLMPMWCGTDYENPLAKSCSTYFNMYEGGGAGRNWFGWGEGVVGAGRKHACALNQQSSRPPPRRTAAASAAAPVEDEPHFSLTCP